MAKSKSLTASQTAQLVDILRHGLTPQQIEIVAKLVNLFHLTSQVISKDGAIKDSDLAALRKLDEDSLRRLTKAGFIAESQSDDEDEAEDDEAEVEQDDDTEVEQEDEPEVDEDDEPEVDEDDEDEQPARATKAKGKPVKGKPKAKVVDEDEDEDDIEGESLLGEDDEDAEEVEESDEDDEPQVDEDDEDAEEVEEGVSFADIGAEDRANAKALKTALNGLIEVNGKEIKAAILKKYKVEMPNKIDAKRLAEIGAKAKVSFDILVGGNFAAAKELLDKGGIDTKRIAKIADKKQKLAAAATAIVAAAITSAIS